MPDNTEIAAGTTFVKTWRLKNNGSCTWTSGYSRVFLQRRCNEWTRFRPNHQWHGASRQHDRYLRDLDRPELRPAPIRATGAYATLVARRLVLVTMPTRASGCR